MPDDKKAARATPADKTAPSDPNTVQARPAPTKPAKTIVAEERGSDGSYTIWYSDGSMESGSGGG